LKRDLPKNIQILTLEPWVGDRCLLRLENILEKNEIADASTTVNLNDIFDVFVIDEVDEMMLGGNVKTSDSNRFHWKVEGEEDTGHEYSQHSQSLPMVELKPMEIRTFLISITRRQPPLE